MDLLNSLIHSTARSLQGQELIYDLGNAIQDYLDDCVRTEIPSFHESRISRRLQESAQKEVFKRQELEQSIREEVHQLQIHHSLLASQIQKDISLKKSRIQSRRKVQHSLESPLAPEPPAINTLSLLDPPSTLSRYQSDFEEIEFLGKGGYGSVVKSKNRIGLFPFFI